MLRLFGNALQSFYGSLLINPPPSTVGLQINSANALNVPGVQIIGSITAGQSNGLFILAGVNNAADRALDVLNQAGSIRLFGVFGDGHFALGYNGTAASITGSAGGNVNIPTPTSGNALSVTGIAGAPFSAYAAVFAAPPTAGQSGGVRIIAGTNSSDHQLVLTNAANTTNFWTFWGDGSLVSNGNTPLGSGSINVNAMYVGGVAVTPGIPQNAQPNNYTLVLSDANKHIYHPSASAHNWVFPSNASVPFPIGTAVTFVNTPGTAGAVTLSINTDTLYWAANNTTGTRTLGVAGVATALKIFSTGWIISGTGLT